MNENDHNAGLAAGDDDTTVVPASTASHAAPARYCIEHVRDFLTVPSDRREACLKEFATWLELADQFAVLLTVDGFDGPKFMSFTWIDDGLRNVTVNVQVKDENDKHLASAVVGPLPYDTEIATEDQPLSEASPSVPSAAQK